MRPETKYAMMNVLSLDPEIRPEWVLDAMNVLASGSIHKEKPGAIIRYPEAMRMLSVTRPTLLELIAKGQLTRVMGSGEKLGIGITAESYNRFIYNHTESPVRDTSSEYAPSSKSELRRIEREQKLRRIRWSYHFNASTTRREKYEAIARTVTERKDVSVMEACQAAGISRSAYLSYLRSIVRPMSERTTRLGKIAELITETYPLTKLAPPLMTIKYMLGKEGIKTTTDTIAILLDRLGYSRNRKMRNRQ